MDGGLSTVHLVVIIVGSVIVLAALVFFYVYMRRMYLSQNNALAGDVVPLMRLKVDCPRCHKRMQPGFALAARGIFWRADQDKPFGLANTPGRLLSSTANWGMRTRENMAWRCEACNMLLVDHSHLLSFK